MIKFMTRFVLVIAASVTAVACQQTGPNTGEFKKYSSDKDVPRMSVAEAKKAFDDKSAVIIDSRPEASFRSEHIAGAINIPFGEQDKLMDRVPKGKKIIIYCS